jgi:hypothetical protein
MSCLWLWLSTITSRSVAGFTDTTVTVKVGNRTRTALLHLPPSFRFRVASIAADDADAPLVPLVFNWHGMCESPKVGSIFFLQQPLI